MSATDILIRQTMDRASQPARHIVHGIMPGRYKQFCRMGFKTAAEAMDHFVRVVREAFAERDVDTIIWRDPLEIIHRDTARDHGWGYYARIGFKRRSIT